MTEPHEPGDMVERVQCDLGPMHGRASTYTRADGTVLCDFCGHPAAALAASGADRMREALEECVKAMAIVTEGNPVGVGKNDKCAHGRYGFEGCESCTDNTLEPALERARQALGEQP